MKIVMCNCIDLICNTTILYQVIDVIWEDCAACAGALGRALCLARSASDNNNDDDEYDDDEYDDDDDDDDDDD